MELSIYRGELARDWFHFSVFICNYVGISIRICGYGFTMSYQIHDPKKNFSKPTEGSQE